VINIGYYLLIMLYDAMFKSELNCLNL